MCPVQSKDDIPHEQDGPLPRLGVSLALAILGKADLESAKALEENQSILKMIYDLCSLGSRYMALVRFYGGYSYKLPPLIKGMEDFTLLLPVRPSTQFLLRKISTPFSFFS